MTNKSFGELLREVRARTGLTLRELAKATGIDAAYLSRIENGKPSFKPTEETIDRLVNGFRVTKQFSRSDGEHLASLLLHAAGYAPTNTQMQINDLTTGFRKKLKEAGFSKEKIDDVFSRLPLPAIQKILRGEELLEDVLGNDFSAEEIRRLRKMGEEVVQQGFRTDYSTYASEMLTAADYLDQQASAFGSRAMRESPSDSNQQSLPTKEEIEAGPHASLQVVGPLTRDQKKQLKAIGQLIESIMG